MSRKLNVQELESRIAPSVGLAQFLANLARTDSNAAALISKIVGADGTVNTQQALQAARDAGYSIPSNIAPIRSSINVNNVMLSDRTAAMLAQLIANGGKH